MVELVKQYATEQAQAQAPNIVDQVIALLPLIIVLMLCFIAIIIFAKWYFDKKEKESDLYREEYRNTIHECIVCKNNKCINGIPFIPRFLATKGVPVFANYPKLTHTKEYYKPKPRKPIDTSKTPKKDEVSEELMVESSESYLIGSYAGHCIGTDGCYNLMVKSAKDKTFGLFPKILIIKLRLPHIQKVLDSKDRKKTNKIIVPPDNVSFSSDIIIINTLGLEKINEYWYCVNMDENGNIVDNKQYAYNDLIDIALQKQVLDLGRNMAKSVDEMTKSNSIVQFLKKTDSSIGSE